ncbi:Iron-containing redox enzyme [Streptomyces sp. yr375]|uniref:iron-containing redox enzyme family protein n=1 Tax=Streptomyces sp. yr375 TaxID=1761906 RepID=UPI0008C60821|nr:iron-containing redox enzyme family protein [Streptomyces sp. yr375]SES03010.1 Iron-containing redox enzyme [Streptomyces sp. yr375]
MIAEDFTIDRTTLQQLLDADSNRWERLNADYVARKRIGDACRGLAHRAFTDRDETALAELHDTLELVYEQDFRVTPVDRLDRDTQPVLRDIASVLECAALSAELADVDEAQISGYPYAGKEFVHWLKLLVGGHPAARHPFYQEFMPSRVTKETFRFYLAQETNLDPRFDDILSLMQVGASPVEKMEIAENHWDEMGNGKPEEVHTTMFSRALESLDVHVDYVRANLLPEAKISGNLACCLALSRRHYYRSIGFFGVTEYLVPRRFKLVVDRWLELGLPRAGIVYHDAHIKIDAGHASGWFKNVIAPAVDADPRIGREIALGALIRLNSSERYLDSLLKHVQDNLALAIS